MKQDSVLDSRLAWWRHCKVGMFIHWGPYAALRGDSRGTGIPFPAEWSRHALRIPAGEYRALAREWNPRRFDAEAVARLAREAGMGYLVFTAKHHDGFCMFDSALTDFTSARSAFGRDPCAELAAACSRQGLHLGLYYSPRDWDHPAYPLHYDHADRPGPRYGGWWGTAVALQTRAVRNLHGGPETAVPDATFLDCGCFGCKANLPIDETDRPGNYPDYRRYLEGQIEELLTKYGEVGVLWFDGQDYRPEEAGTAALLAKIRRLSPTTIVNDRIGSDGFQADFGVAESYIPATGAARDWEACMTMPFVSWGYDPNAHSFHTPAEVIHQVIDVVSKGGNMLINVSPDELGLIPGYQCDRLRILGRWLNRFGEAIYGTTRANRPAPPGLRFTVRGDVLYLLQVENPGADVWIPGLVLAAAAEVELLGSRRLLRWENHPERGLHLRVGELPACHWFGEAALAFRVTGALPAGA